MLCRDFPDLQALWYRLDLDRFAAPLCCGTLSSFRQMVEEASRHAGSTEATKESDMRGRRDDTGWISLGLQQNPTLDWLMRRCVSISRKDMLPSYTLGLKR